jgi:hypothetical protein
MSLTDEAIARTDCESTIAAEGAVTRPATSRTRSRNPSNQPGDPTCLM